MKPTLLLLLLLAQSCASESLFKCETELDIVRYKLETCENKLLIEEIERRSK